MCENHALEQHCRVCGGRLQKAKSRKTYYDCTHYKEELRTILTCCNSKASFKEGSTAVHINSVYPSKYGY